eukprot:TRINITY_DN1720_c0_g1_i1.p1 TRINITY_DN1720_c0_g1~~TRINITY_DN1720_c0_g1_i1.p1  ORF type:complete len:380 (-),score=58.79 TRINITY_DN1720_c0_g1_i1:743-1723(-)
MDNKDTTQPEPNSPTANQQNTETNSPVTPAPQTHSETPPTDNAQTPTNPINATESRTSVTQEQQQGEEPAPKRQKTEQKLTKQQQAEQLTREKYEQTVKMYALMRKSAKPLSLPHLTIATAIVFFHRFIQKLGSIRHCDPKIAAAACLFVACKSESTQKRLRELIEVLFNVVEKDQPRDYNHIKEKITDTEAVLLQYLGFSFFVDPPYRTLVQTITMLQGSEVWKELGWLLITDALNTSLCLKYEAPKIAKAVLRLSAKFLEDHPTPCTSQMFEEATAVDEEVVLTVRKSILNYYYFRHHQYMIDVLSGVTKYNPAAAAAAAAPLC